jgi:hypothetical protein
MKAKRQIESSLNSVTMLDGTGGHVNGDEVDESTLEHDAHRNVSDVAQDVIGKRGLHGGKRPGGGGREAKEDIDVAVAEIGAFGVGAGERDGLEIWVITPAAKQKADADEGVEREVVRSHECVRHKLIWSADESARRLKPAPLRIHRIGTSRSRGRCPWRGGGREDE